MSTAAGQVTGLVLAGGEGRRLGKLDKGLLELGGRPLAIIAAERLRPQVARLLLSANRNLEAYRALGLEVITDTVADGDRTAGPLAGVLAGLEHCTTEWLACVPCDSPTAPLDMVSRLLASASAAHAPAAYASTDQGAHPVFMMVRRACLADLRDFVQQGGRRIRAWQDTLGAIAVHFPDEAAFANINTEAELQRHRQDSCARPAGSSL
jgi:molybdopterin-guanine dinucleotide biosynthesis protein A